MKTRMSDGMLLGNIRGGERRRCKKGFLRILTRFVYFFLLFLKLNLSRMQVGNLLLILIEK